MLLLSRYNKCVFSWILSPQNAIKRNTGFPSTTLPMRHQHTIWLFWTESCAANDRAYVRSSCVHLCVRAGVTNQTLLTLRRMYARARSHTHVHPHARTHARLLLFAHITCLLFISHRKTRTDATPTCGSNLHARTHMHTYTFFVH